jgi:hypothetical protein
MYDQMFSDVSRQISVVWEAVTVLAGSFAVLSLVEKQIITSDIAASVIVLLAAWVVAHALEGSYWYFRNLAIIVNIERTFLTRADLTRIHPYFGKYPKYRPLRQLWLQVLLAASIASLALGVHFWVVVRPTLVLTRPCCDWPKLLPYVVCVVCLALLVGLHVRHSANYREFLKECPGPELAGEAPNERAPEHESARE